MPTPDPTADLALVARAQDGDVSAFETLVRTHHRRAFAVALRITQDPTDAEDCTQDAFVRAWRALPGYRRDAAFSTWMYRIVTNVALNHVTRRRERARGDVPDVHDPTDQPESRSVHRERLDVVVGALGTLTPEQRAVYVLRDVEGLSYDDIATTLQISLAAVKSRLFRARQDIAAVLAAYDSATLAPTSDHGRQVTA